MPSRSWLTNHFMGALTICLRLLAPSIPPFLGKWCTHTLDREHIALFHAAALIAALACVALLLAGCGSSKASADAGTVNFLIEASPTNFDPRVGADAYSEHIDGLIFSSLVAHDDQMKVIPDLAQSWETPDPLTYVFHLRSGVRFHDGRLLTSADVKYTFDSIISGRVENAETWLVQTGRFGGSP